MSRPGRFGVQRGGLAERRPTWNDQPSNPPGTTGRLYPTVLYLQGRPSRADQYDQYAVVGGIRVQRSW
jgi:hypothetical protein